MRIDAYTHFFPKKFFDMLGEVAADYPDMGKRVRSLPALYDLARATRSCSPPIARSIPRAGRCIRETLRILESLDLSKADRDKIFFRNLEAVTGRRLVKS
jgi:hypothetical protein